MTEKKKELKNEKKIMKDKKWKKLTPLPDQEKQQKMEVGEELDEGGPWAMIVWFPQRWVLDPLVR